MARTYTIRRKTGGDPLYRIDYRAELNAAQYEAATTLDGPVLVVAGAGSGKTRTLVYRVARLIESFAARLLAQIWRLRRHRKHVPSRQ